MIIWYDEHLYEKDILDDNEIEIIQNTGTYYNGFLPDGENDFIRYSDGKGRESEILNNIDVPILIIFGDIDECVLTQPIEIVKDYLGNNIDDCCIEIIEGADHFYTNKYNELEIAIKNNF